MTENGEKASAGNPGANDHSAVTRPAPGPIDSPGMNLVPADLSAVQGDAAESHTGSYIGRYQIIRRLGQGGFGTVYLARDQELERLVAIKLPHLSRMQSSSFRTEFLAEARTLAKLDHPSIVPIYDCGVINDGRCFVVSKYIEGRDLARVLVQGPIEPLEVVRLMIEAAEALQHVHRCGIVHRDIKPANILLGHDGRVYVADFGLAQRETHGNHATRFAGTPSYMSPEQVRGEGHRIDGRSDLFSLGVTMYELLTGERPFSRGTAEEIFHRVLTVEPFPPDQLNGRVPMELSRICMKLMAKLASQRYADAGLLMADLRDWKNSATLESGELLMGGPPADGTTIVPTLVPSENLRTEVRTISSGTVVPRGLRAFTRADAGFYPDLLPGVRDRDGLPVIIGHWKNWVTQREEAPDLHTAGVIFGPTGCGKSSLVRAGILPSLPDSCLTAFVDASADMTERQLMMAIDRRCHERLSGDLTELLTAIRTGAGLRPGQSLLIVIDQFEQWLHAHPDPKETQLLRALRQCDGVRLQCLLLIRDDFWLALSRFMEVLEVPLQLGRNATLIDLFDRQHSQKVLAEFGRGYGQLPTDPSALSKEHQRFLEGAVDSLSTDGKVIPVHLALFAEMVKSREWKPATLRQLGGASGIGARFLTESFSTSSSPAHQRAYEEPARRILETLLPDPGTEIKASRRTRAELLEVSGYKDDPARFTALMVILETDLKLITGADLIDRTRSEASGSQSSEQSAWQLSHDFLVPSVREWLMAKRRESLQGRVRQRLAEQARYWSFDQDARHLPGPVEWGLMRCLISRRQMSAVESQLMAAADIRILRTAGLIVASVLLLFWAWYRFESRSAMQARMTQLATSVPGEVTRVIDELHQFGTPARAAIETAVAGAEEGSRERFLFQSASLKWSDANVEEVFDYTIRHADISDVPVAGVALSAFAEQLVPQCWSIIENRAGAMGEKSSQPFSGMDRFRAVQLLAGFFDSPDKDAEQRWNVSRKEIASLVLEACSQNPNQYAIIESTLAPIKQQLLPALTEWIGREQKDVSGSFALSLIIGYTEDNAAQRTGLLLDASDWQVERLLNSPLKLDENVLWQAIDSSPAAGASESELIRHAHRRAMAGSLLLTSAEQRGTQSLQLDALWKDLAFSSDMTCRTYLIRFLPARRFPLKGILRRLGSETDPGILAGLLLIAGDYSGQEVDAIRELTASAGRLYHTHPNAAVHSAAEWVLRERGMTQVLNSVPIGVSGDVASVEDAQRPRWKRIPQGLTLVEIDGTATPGLGRRFLMSSTEVTRDQMHAFNPSHYVNPQFSPTSDSPASVVRWNDAVNYCNWLSAREGLPPFYPETPEEQDAWTSTVESLQAPGYRLPTDAEWEFASLAGAVSECSFGRDTLQVDRYGWYEANHSQYLAKTGQSAEDDEERVSTSIFAKPVGLLRPNEYGLFDMYGNVEEWCDDRGQSAASERAIRGGGARAYRQVLNSRRIGSLLPASQYDSLGFRIVRTIK